MVYKRVTCYTDTGVRTFTKYPIKFFFYREDAEEYAKREDFLLVCQIQLCASLAKNFRI